MLIELQDMRQRKSWVHLYLRGLGLDVMEPLVMQQLAASHSEGMAHHHSPAGPQLSTLEALSITRDVRVLLWAWRHPMRPPDVLHEANILQDDLTPYDASASTASKVQHLKRVIMDDLRGEFQTGSWPVPADEILDHLATIYLVSCAESSVSEQRIRLRSALHPDAPLQCPDLPAEAIHEALLELAARLGTTPEALLSGCDEASEDHLHISSSSSSSNKKASAASPSPQPTIQPQSGGLPTCPNIFDSLPEQGSSQIDIGAPCVLLCHT